MRLRQFTTNASPLHYAANIPIIGIFQKPKCYDLLSIAKYFSGFVFYALDNLILDEYSIVHFFVWGVLFFSINFSKTINKGNTLVF